MALPGVLHKMSKRAERMNINFDPDSIVKVEDHLDNFYLQLQTLEVWYDDIACRLFPCTLDSRAVAWCHSLPPNSIQNWGEFKCMFLEKFIDDKTPTMLLRELGSLKMEGKEKVKDFNQMFKCILNKFAVDTKPHDSITTDYCTSTLPTSIAQFIKRVSRPTLLENYEEAIVVEKDMRVIGVIKDDEPAKEFKDTSKKSQAMASKGRDKEATNIETFTHLVKRFSTEMFEPKQCKIDTFASSHPSR